MSPLTLLATTRAGGPKPMVPVTTATGPLSTGYTAFWKLRAARAPDGARAQARTTRVHAVRRGTGRMLRPPCFAMLDSWTAIRSYARPGTAGDLCGGRGP